MIHGKIVRLFGVFASLCISILCAETLAHAQEIDQPEPSTHKIFLPLVDQRDYYPGGYNPMLGLSPVGYVGDQAVVDRELLQMENWAGKRFSIVAFFHDIQDGNPAYNIPLQLNTLYKNGYTGFIQLNTTQKMSSFAQGYMDADIHELARIWRDWAAQGSDRMAFLALFPEMNGDWTPYGEDPGNYKLAFKRFRDIFAQEGVPKSSIRWVFPPNGWSAQNMPFESFYPGDDQVDVLAFSSYNYGHCPAASPWYEWSTPDEVFGSYIQRMEAMAPTKPIMIAQSATSAMNAGGQDDGAKNQWLRDAYAYLAETRSVKAYLYFNIRLECDWPIYVPGGIAYAGYKDAAANPAYVYLNPTELSELDLTIKP